jgi:hypothetical protein
MDSGTLLEFDPRFPKMFAGIGTFLERDTLSRSLVIRMERYLLAESRRVKEYLLCTDNVTLPVYQAFLRYWTDERKAVFGQTCRKVIHQFPEEFMSRRRLKFVPLLAVAEMGGSSLYEETMEAAKWMHGVPDSGTVALPHRLLCDVARCYYRQVMLFLQNIPDPLTKKPSVVIQSGRSAWTRKLSIPGLLRERSLTKTANAEKTGKLTLMPKIRAVTQFDFSLLIREPK